ncbi:DUF982 domain-containing protein [Mesorhizobium sp. M1216]|uniref:DUF982 domain-containing protein n=1 Tax=Mesorhizobium sp. M1216 TaxID=2957069 RepID=UPI00333E0212
MSSGTFSSPLFVRRAAHIVQEITSPADAFEFLNEWPEDRRDRIYEAALRACFDAYNGRKPASAARKTFPLCETGPHIGRCNLRDAMARCLHVGQWKSASIGVAVVCEAGAGTPTRLLYPDFAGI